MTESHTPVPEPLGQSRVRSIIKAVPGLAAPLIGLAADFVSPEVMVGGAALVFALERAQKSGALGRVLDKQVAAHRISPKQRDRVLAIATRVGEVVPLSVPDVAMLATLVPELEIAAPLVKRMPVLRSVSAGVRQLITGKQLFAGAAKLGGAEPGLGVA